MDMLENILFDELEIGQKDSIERTLTDKDIKAFALISGNVNPAHLDPEYAKLGLFHQRIGPGLWGGILISGVLGTKLPGPGTIYLNQTLSFRKPVYIGDRIKIELTVADKFPETKRVILYCRCTNQNGEIVITGQAEVIAPTKKFKQEAAHLPEIFLYDEGKKLRDLIDRAAKMKGRLSIGVIHPTNEQSIKGVVLAAENNLIDPVLIGPVKRINQAAKELGVDISAYKIVAAKDEVVATKKAVELVHSGEINALMKGEIHTDVMMRIIVSREANLRTDRRISHVAVFDVPEYHKLMFVSDAAINILPDLKTKKDIVQNAIDLAQFMGIKKPKVALLSAVEVELKGLPATADIKELCKMAETGEITGAILEGPLAFDIAISKWAANSKHVKSAVAGDPDILIVPNIEVGNIMGKALEYLAHATYAGMVIGTKVPIVLTSRAVDPIERLASCALAKIYVSAQKK